MWFDGVGRGYARETALSLVLGRCNYVKVWLHVWKIGRNIRLMWWAHEHTKQKTSDRDFIPDDTRQKHTHTYAHKYIHTSIQWMSERDVKRLKFDTSKAVLYCLLKPWEHLIEIVLMNMISLTKYSPLSDLKIDVGNFNYTETGLDECRTMASIVTKMISDSKYIIFLLGQIATICSNRKLNQISYRICIDHINFHTSHVGLPSCQKSIQYTDSSKVDYLLTTWYWDYQDYHYHH